MAKLLEKETIDELCGKWVAGATTEQLSHEYGVGKRTIGRYLKDRGIDQKTRNQVQAPGSGAAMTPDVASSFFANLGEPDSDPLGSVEWLRKALIASARQALVDPLYVGKEALRRKELREIASAVGKVITPAAMFDAKKLINADNEDLEKTKAGPETVTRAEI